MRVNKINNRIMNLAVVQAAWTEYLLPEDDLIGNIFFHLKSMKMKAQNVL